MQDSPDAAYLREQAARCRRLADSVTDQAARVTLRAMANEYEARAAGMGAPLLDGMPHPKMTPPGASGTGG